MVRMWAARAGTRLGVAALVLAAVAAVLGLLVAPTAAIQGPAQRLMYVHVPGAWTAFASFGCVALCSIAVLLRRPGRYDAVAAAAAEVGVAMTGVTLAEGSIWGHDAWGVWWAWDPRLVSTALLFVSYIAYLGLRAMGGPDPARATRRNALAGLIFAIQLPIVHFSVLWWRTLHQPPTVLRPSLSPPPIAPLMLLALLTATGAFTLGAAWYIRRRVLSTPVGVPVAAPLPAGEAQPAGSEAEETRA